MVFKGSVEKIIFLLKLEERNECKNNRYIITNPAWSRSPSCPRSCETKFSMCVYGRMSPGGQKCPGALRLSCGPENRQCWPGGGASAPGVMWRARKGTQRGSGGGSGLVSRLLGWRSLPRTILSSRSGKRLPSHDLCRVSWPLL